MKSSAKPLAVLMAVFFLLLVAIYGIAAIMS
jgi:hypothetical protein